MPFTPPHDYVSTAKKSLKDLAYVANSVSPITPRPFHVIQFSQFADDAQEGVVYGVIAAVHQFKDQNIIVLTDGTRIFVPDLPGE